jgi:hypothetical protein
VGDYAEALGPTFQSTTLCLPTIVNKFQVVRNYRIPIPLCKGGLARCPYARFLADNELSSVPDMGLEPTSH